MTASSDSAIGTAARKAGLLDNGTRVDHVHFKRKLRFGATDIQSAMDLRDPDHLVLSYTRLMMAFLLFQPQPQHILMIGLGGGSLPKFCHRHLPGSDITVVEIDPAVIALREQFEIPPDQSNFRVVQADGADFVAAVDDDRFNVILVDGFEAEQMAPALGTQNFYGHCERLLRPGGVMLCNLHELDIHYGVFLDRVAVTFDDNTLKVSTRECGNSIVFARKDTAIDARLPRHLERPASMAPKCLAGHRSRSARRVASGTPGQGIRVITLLKAKRSGQFGMGRLHPNEVMAGVIVGGVSCPVAAGSRSPGQPAPSSPCSRGRWPSTLSTARHINPIDFSFVFLH